MKKMLHLLVLIISLGVFMFGCSDYPSEISFDKFPQFNKFEIDKINSINVFWDSGDNALIEFQIPSHTTADVISSLKDTKFIKAKSGLADGDHGYITLNFDNKEIKLNLFQNQYGDKEVYYNYLSQDFYNQIKAIGKDIGAIK